MTTALKFRNIDASPGDPVDTWPFEGILAAVERGTLPDWRRLAKAINADPWGPLAQQVLEAIRFSHPYGTAELLEGVVARARNLAADSEREEVASEVGELVKRSGLSRQEFAERIGTSRTRLSTYVSGKVVPSAALMVRMRRVAINVGPTPAGHHLWCARQAEMLPGRRGERSRPASSAGRPPTGWGGPATTRPRPR